MKAHSWVFPGFTAVEWNVDWSEGELYRILAWSTDSHSPHVGKITIYSQART